MTDNVTLEFIAGLKVMRDEIAQYVENDGLRDSDIREANIIRRFWRPEWGRDPGAEASDFAAPPDAPEQKPDWDAWARGACAEIAAKIDAQLKPKAGEFAELVVFRDTMKAHAEQMAEIADCCESLHPFANINWPSNAACLREAAAAILTLTARLEQAERERDDERASRLALERTNVWKIRADVAEAANAKLREALEWIMKNKWKSDKDNMEFTGTISCYQMDKIREALSHSPSGGDGGVQK